MQKRGLIAFFAAFGLLLSLATAFAADVTGTVTITDPQALSLGARVNVKPTTVGGTTYGGTFVNGATFAWPSGQTLYYSVSVNGFTGRLVKGPPTASNFTIIVGNGSFCTLLVTGVPTTFLPGSSGQAWVEIENAPAPNKFGNGASIYMPNQIYIRWRLVVVQFGLTQTGPWNLFCVLCPAGQTSTIDATPEWCQMFITPGAGVQALVDSFGRGFNNGDFLIMIKKEADGSPKSIVWFPVINGVPGLQQTKSIDCTALSLANACNMTFTGIPLAPAGSQYRIEIEGNGTFVVPTGTTTVQVSVPLGLTIRWRLYLDDLVAGSNFGKHSPSGVADGWECKYVDCTDAQVEEGYHYVNVRFRYLWNTDFNKAGSSHKTQLGYLFGSGTPTPYVKFPWQIDDLGMNAFPPAVPTVTQQAALPSGAVNVYARAMTITPDESPAHVWGPTYVGAPGTTKYAAGYPVVIPGPTTLIPIPPQTFSPKTWSWDFNVAPL